jgi:hypothetical protein
MWKKSKVLRISTKLSPVQIMVGLSYTGIRVALVHPYLYVIFCSLCTSTSTYVNLALLDRALRLPPYHKSS